VSAGRDYACDVAILGGGVAGLWLLGRLRRAGYHAVLLESQAIGAGQTRYAQGIIHGGTKYALSGKLSGSSEAIAAMPGRWRECLAGSGELDLSSVRLLSDHQYLWSTTRLTSRLAGFFASKLMRARTHTVEGAERPELFRHPAFRGQVYRLDEPVLDTASLVAELARDAPIFRAEGLRLDPAAPTTLQLADGRRLSARRLVLAAGAGNAALLGQLGRDAPQMQRRPLKMVMLRGGELPVLYAHCLGASANPRLTVTSHFDRAGHTVWYLGGQPAEEGVGRSDAAQIEALRSELATLFPWLDFGPCQWACLDIDRAEVKMSDGSRPADIFATEADGVITAWPTKLAFAPRLADRVLELLQQAGIGPGEAAAPPDWPRPEQAVLPWQEEERWN
jgi:glycerol-3-phosphate dehydrogenase